MADRELAIYKRLTRESGWKITLWTYGDQSDFDYKGIAGNVNIFPVYAYVKKYKNKWPRFIQSIYLPFYFRELIKSADLLKTNQMFGGWVAVVAKLAYRKKLIVRSGWQFLRNYVRNEAKYHARCIKFCYGFLIELFTYSLADAIVHTSRGAIQFCYKLFPHLKLKKVFLQRNYVDTELFAPNNNGKNKKHSDRLLYVGRLHECKNLINLFEAFKESPYSLDIVGQGPLKTKLDKLISHHNLNVRFLGTFPNNELPGILREYSAFILPSFFENSPKAIIEAMSCGCAVIGTKVDGINELIDHEHTGICCETDSRSLKRAINFLMDKPEEYRIKLGLAARDFVRAKCSFNVFFLTELNIYSDILK